MKDNDGLTYGFRKSNWYIRLYFKYSLENYQDTTSPQGKVRPYSKILLIVMFLYQKERRPYVCVLVAQSCLTLCDPMDCSPQGSPLHGIRQSRILEWVAIPFSRGSSWPRSRTWVSCIVGGFFTIWATSYLRARISVLSEASSVLPARLQL